GKVPAKALEIVGAGAQAAGDYLLSHHAVLPPPSSTPREGHPQDTASIVADATSAFEKVTSAANRIVGTKTAEPFAPPEGIACSTSTLTWNETSDIFGRRVANTYVAIQVTIRNLDNKNEFLVHDIQVAVDTGMGEDQWGRFQAGHDKLLARGVAEKSQTES